MVPIKAIDSHRMRDNFSGHARNYDTYASVQKRVVELLRHKLLESVPTNGVFLDIGTGTGALAAALCEDVPEQELVVMDIAHGMTREAMQRVAGCSACDGDARLLPFAAGAFTCVASSSVYQWVDSLPEAFAEVGRVLVNNGFFAVALFGEKTLHELRNSHRQAVAESNGSRGSHVQNFPSQSEVAEALAHAGLTIHSLSSTMEVEFHQDVPDLLRQLKQIGASNAAADRPKGMASRKVMQTMMAIYEEGFRSANGLPASYEVIIAIAQKKKAV